MSTSDRDLAAALYGAPKSKAKPGRPVQRDPFFAPPPANLAGLVQGTIALSDLQRWLAAQPGGARNALVVGPDGEYYKPDDLPQDADGNLLVAASSAAKAPMIAIDRSTLDRNKFGADVMSSETSRWAVGTMTVPDVLPAAAAEAAPAADITPTDAADVLFGGPTS